jgi:D-alanyl-D-alanine-carboxypeptidase/D-alanyl-D-alanine-endopeptidase
MLAQRSTPTSDLISVVVEHDFAKYIMLRFLLYAALAIVTATIALLGSSFISDHIKALQYQAMTDTHNLKARVEQLATDYVAQRENVGLVVGIYQRGQESVQGFGLSNQANMPPDGTSIYEIGSISKLFTGITLAALEQDGQVGLNDPIADYLPPEVSPSPEVANITLQQLATHTSGLLRLPDTLLIDSVDETNPYRNYTASDLYQDLEQVRLTYPPGTAFEYSNFGMGLLGHLLELRTNTPYEELVQKTIGTPLEMIDTTIDLSPEQQQRLIRGYSPDGEIASNWEFDVLAPAGAFRSTANDMLRFIQASLTETDTPISQAIVRSQELKFGDRNGEVGLAWQILELPERLTFHWHNGGTGGYASFVGVDRVHQTGVILLSNYGDAIVGDFSLDRMGVELLKLASKISLESKVTPLP